MSRNPQGEPRTAPLDSESVEFGRKIGVIEAERRAVALIGQLVLAAGGEIRVPMRLRSGDDIEIVFSEDFHGDHVYAVRGANRAIEAEAAAPVEGLDVERLRLAMDRTLWNRDTTVSRPDETWYEAIAREYAALRAIESPAHPETAE